jgi:serine/threonine protein kinase
MSDRKDSIDRFQIGELLGTGGMAAVFMGVDTVTGESVAIKLLKREAIVADPDIVARFEREGEALRRLNHPNITQVLATIEADGDHYVVMEYVGGGDLRSLLDQYRQRNEMLSIARVLDIALDLADALTRAHRLKIIHRDIKPANVLLAHDGTPRLTDFGVAHFSDAARMTQTGTLIGTLYYMSPEACAGEDLDPRADIWSFGVMLYEMLTLRRPFEGTNSAALLNAVMNKNPSALEDLRPEVPEALASLIQWMLFKDPMQRIPSARLVGAQLEAIINGTEISVEPVPRSTERKVTRVIDPVMSDPKPDTDELSQEQLRAAVERDPSSSDEGAPEDLVPRSMVPDRLLVLMPNNEIVTYENLHPYLLIGRCTVSGGQDIDVDMSPFDADVLGVSRVHAQILPDEMYGLMLKDLQSTNGTTLNGRQIEPDQSYPLRDGDFIKVGNLKIQIFVEYDP